MDSKKYFVGGLAMAVTDDVLREYLEHRVGPVKFAMVAYDRETGHHRGFGFVQFHSSFADRDVVALRDAELCGKRLTIREARDSMR